MKILKNTKMLIGILSLVLVFGFGSAAMAQGQMAWDDDDDDQIVSADDDSSEMINETQAQFLPYVSPYSYAAGQWDDDDDDDDGTTASVLLEDDDMEFDEDSEEL